ncbi:MAG: beta-galactosidase [Tepidisphaeraceae bacterium]
MEHHISRRQFIKQSALVAGAAISLPILPSLAAEAAAPAVNPLTLDASTPPAPAGTAGFHMGTATAPGGRTLTLDSRSLLLDGRPWVFISGEFHYARCPETEWRDELLKIKAGGVSVVASYIFWIHHEESEGVWDWTGRRDLHKFLQTCQEVGLHVLLRIGPWCHGEVRNGGFPDWLQKMGDSKAIELRRDNPGYLAYVTRLYAQIAQETRGLLWKDGGPLIAIQVENEYSGPTEHLMTLKRIAREAGIDVPLYTCTGWGAGGAAPFGELVPFSGSYVDGFWDRSLAGGGYGGVLRFSGPRGRGNAAAMGMVGTEAAATNPTPASTVVSGVYPSCTCELGGGMMPSYHRRVYLWPEDAESLALVRLGSGVNLLGFYMYHGGQNPDGKLSNLNETQASGYWNDLPVKNYDFQAPIGEYGQEREHYHWLRLLGLFLRDFGSAVAGMTSRIPAARGSLNWAVRSDGESGYLFVSHYQHLSPQPNRDNVQFCVKLAGGEITAPSAPVTIPYNSRFFWPLNLDLGGVKVIVASAQPICQVNDGNTRYTVFKQTGGIPAEFVFDGTTATVDFPARNATNGQPQIQVRNVPTGLGAAIRLHGKDGTNHVIILLDETTALDLWKGQWQGEERLFLTHASLLIDGSTLRLRSDSPADFSVAILPAPASLTDGKGNLPATEDGVFRRFSPRMAPEAPLQVAVEQVQPAGPARAIPIAPSVPTRRVGMAMQPEDADFAQAAVWRVKLPAGVDASRDLRLRVRYTGDVIRAYHNDQLLDDDFYNARPFEIGLRRYGPAVYQDGLVLKILPLREDAPVYITDRSKLKFDSAHTALSVDGVDVVETHEARLESGN